MVKFILESTTKITSYISESGTMTVPCINGSLVSRFPNDIYLRTDEDQIVGGFELATGEMGGVEQVAKQVFFLL